MSERCVGGRSDLGDNNEWFARIEDFDFSYSKARYLDKKESVRRSLAKMAVCHSSDSDSYDEAGSPALNTPVYPPFFNAIQLNNRVVVENPQSYS